MCARQRPTFCKALEAAYLEGDAAEAFAWLHVERLADAKTRAVGLVVVLSILILSGVGASRPSKSSILPVQHQRRRSCVMALVKCLEGRGFYLMWWRSSRSDR
eukprot:2842656-Amphidinium_carterae.1